MKKIKIVLIIVVFFLLIILLGKLVSFKYVKEYLEGSFVRDYYMEENSHDIIFLGDCEVYTSISPIYMYEKYGITSFVRGNSRQLINQSYYLLKETLKYEKPKIVALSVSVLPYEGQIKEEYNRLLLDDMKWSREKISLMKASLMNNESYLSYIFPLLRYHSRITSLNSDDFKYLFSREVVSHNGFLINQEVKALNILPGKRILDNPNFPKENINYLNKIYDLCQENNITLILFKSPNLYPHWYQEYENWLINYAQEKNITYYNFLNNDDINLDFQYDTYDGGNHLNLRGAEKLTNYFGQILKEKYSLTDYRNNTKINEDYQRKIERYNNEKNS